MRSLRDLKIVRALDTHRNFARAADELGMSQPNLSRALVRLEQAIGAPLFERSRTAVVPTAFAEIVLERGNALIAGFEDLAQLLELKRNEDERGFRVSVGPFAAEAVGLQSFAEHAASGRGSFGRLVTRDWQTCLDDVLTGRSDLAITDTISASEYYPDIETEVLGGGPARFFCDRRHPLAQRAEVGWDDVMRFPWALPLIQARYLDLLPSDLGAAGRRDPETGDFVPAICVDSFSAIVAAVRNGRAIGAGSPSFIRYEIEAGDFVTLPLEEPWMRIEYGLVWRAGRPWSRALAQFVDKLRATQEQANQMLARQA